MKRTSLFLLSALATLSVSAQDVYLEENFENGIPSQMTNLDYDELPITGGFNFAVTPNWFSRSIFGNYGKSAVSTSRHDFDLPTSNWLITPQLSIKSAAAVIAWDAKSVHYDLRDGYRVLISTTGNQPESFHELFQVDEEGYTWQHHTLSLSDYAGKNVYLAFEHNSQNKFLLAIDNLFVGVPQKVAFDVDNRTPHFCGHTSTTQIEGSLRNIGKAINVKTITCTSGLTQISQNVDALQETGDQIDFNFEIPVRLNEAIPYTIDMVTADGESLTALSDSIVCSYYPRTLLVEKGTGAWCTSCPGVMGYINELQEEFKNEIVVVESHSTYNDNFKLSFQPYDEGMATANFPVIYFNRNQSTPCYDKASANELLKERILDETPAMIQAEAQWENGKIHVKTTTSFGKPLDNSKDKYRIGFALLQNRLQFTYPTQKSSVSGAQYQEFGLMSSPIAEDLMFYHHIARGTESAFIGIPSSLPAQIQIDTPYQLDEVIDLPESLKNVEDITVVAFVTNYFNKHVLNTTAIPVEAPTGIASTRATTAPIQVNLQKNNCEVTLPAAAPFYIQVFDNNGKEVASQEGQGTHCHLTTTHWHPGTYVLRVTQQGNTQSVKILLP